MTSLSGVTRGIVGLRLPKVEVVTVAGEKNAGGGWKPQNETGRQELERLRKESTEAKPEIDEKPSYNSRSLRIQTEPEILDQISSTAS